MRVFFAIEFNDEIKEYINKIKEELRPFCSSGNFTHKENFHLTLRFIGEATDGQAEQLKLALKETAANASNFSLNLNELGNFDKGNKKIIWMGLKQSQSLVELYRQLEKVLLRYGYNCEARGFSPHITLAREVRMNNLENLPYMKTNDDIIIKVNSISLMESKRIDNKLCYLPIATARFDKELYS